MQPWRRQGKRIVSWRSLGEPGVMWVYDSRIEARERPDVRVAHRKSYTRHAAHVESHNAESRLVHKGQLPDARDGELEIADLRLEILCVDSYQWSIGSNERSGHHYKATTCQVLAHSGERDCRFVVKPKADHDQGELACRGLGVLHS